MCKFKKYRKTDISIIFSYKYRVALTRADGWVRGFVPSMKQPNSTTKKTRGKGNILG